MRGYANWNYKPWVQANARQEAVSPCIRRIAPGDTTIQVEWFDLGDAGEHVLQYRQYHKFMPWKIMRAEQGCVEISGLTPDVEYEFQVARADGSACSPLRLARTGAPEGVVINYLHPEDSTYLCSGRYFSLFHAGFLPCASKSAHISHLNIAPPPASFGAILR